MCSKCLQGKFKREDSVFLWQCNGWRALLGCTFAEDGWVDILCVQYVCNAVFALLLLTGDCGGSDDYDCIPGSLLAQRFRASSPQDFPPLYFASPTRECSYPGYTYQQNQHTIPGKTSRKKVQELIVDVGSLFKWEISYITVGYLFS